MLSRFFQASGFKILGAANLSSCEYSLIFYLLNTVVSGFPQILTNEEELEILLGRSKNEISSAIDSLSNRDIIKIRFSDKATTKQENPSMMISFNFDYTKWTLPHLDKAEREARIYPFSRGKFQSIKGGGQPRTEHSEEEETTERILKLFLNGRSLDDIEIEEANWSARQLVETHPVDQILLLIRHFGLRIPTLSLLASNWQHFGELYFEETQSIDMMEARHKHQELDSLLRERSEHFLTRESLGNEEKNILRILINHRHPRRQLFWAFQSRSRYPGLNDFFEENSGLMLGVTSTGSIVKNRV